MVFQYDPSKERSDTSRAYEERHMRFEDLEFAGSQEGIARARVPFGTYELSVIREPHKSRYEIAIFDDTGSFVQLPGIHRTPADDRDWVDDVIPCLTPDEVSGIMVKLATISG